MVCIRCKSGGLYKKGQQCEHCFREMNGLPPCSSKLKQTVICEFIVHNVLKGFDGVFLNECIIGKRIFPDLRFNYLSFEIVIEIDENQHKQYKNEDKRIDDLKEVFHRLILIRINPDKYDSYPPMIDSSKKIISSDGDIAEHIFITKHSGEIERRFTMIKNELIYLLCTLFTDYVYSEKKLPKRYFQLIKLFYSSSSSSSLPPPSAAAAASIDS